MIFIKNDACAKSVLQIQSLSLGEGSCLREMVLRKWKTALEIVNGKNQKDVTSSEGTFPIYGSGGVIGRATGFLCPAGTTIVGRKGTINRPIYVNEPFWNVDTAFGLVPGNELNSKYLYYFCCGFNFTKLDNSTTIPSLSKSVLLEIEIPVPPLPEQERIVARIEELFSELDKGVEALQMIKAQLKVYRQAVLKEAFAGITNKIELGSWIKRIETGKSLRCIERPPTTGEHGLIKISAVTWGDYNEQESKTCPPYYQLNTNILIKSGDFLFSRANTQQLVGACVIVRHVTKHLMLSDKILRFVFNDNISPEYVLHFLRSGFGRKQIESLSTGNQESMRNIGQDRIRSIQIPICSLDEQISLVRGIESRLSVCDKIEQTVDESLAKAESLRQSILKKAFEGRL